MKLIHWKPCIVFVVLFPLIGIAGCGNGVNEAKIKELKTVLAEKEICKKHNGKVINEPETHQKNFFFIPIGKEPIVTVPASRKDKYAASVLFTYGGSCLIEGYSSTENIRVGTQVWDEFHPPSLAGQVFDAVTSIFKKPIPQPTSKP